MSVEIVVDPGSTHMGKMRYAEEHIRIAANLGVDVVKFQMFKGEFFTQHGNVEMPYSWLSHLVSYGTKFGIKVTASTFDKESLEILTAADVPFIKFAHSQSNRYRNIKGLINTGKRVVVSADVMNKHLIPEGADVLFCQPVYPTMWHTNFQGLFPSFFGLSDHSLGFVEAKSAVEHGAKMVEKHVSLPYADITCPDGKFGLQPKDLERFVKEVRDA